MIWANQKVIPFERPHIEERRTELSKFNSTILELGERFKANDKLCPCVGDRGRPMRELTALVESKRQWNLCYKHWSKADKSGSDTYIIMTTRTAEKSAHNPPPKKQKQP